MADGNESIWKRLTRLFRSGPVVRHRIAAAERQHEPQGTARAYKKELSSLYVNSLASYGQFERLARYADYSEMELCIAGDTVIPVPGGWKTIAELADEHGSDRPFIVYAFDHAIGTIVPALAKHARKTRTDAAWKVTFDNGKSIVGTPDHRLMLRDGSYRKIEELAAGDAMMPFYRRSLRSPLGRHDPDHYQYIYDCKGWTAEHRMVGAWMEKRELLDSEVVHHKNFKKNDNRPENLEVMNGADHHRFHAVEINGRRWDRTKNAVWIEKFSREHSRFMSENNPATRHDVTFAKVLQVAEANGFNLYRTAETLGTGFEVIGRRLAEKSFVNWTAFAKAYDQKWRNHGWDNRGEKNPRFDDALTFQMVCDAFERGMNGNQLCVKLGTTPMKVKGRVKQHGFKSAADFCRRYENCKVVSVEPYGVIDLYDMTVDGYKNFATDSVISHNTPEIASSLDIYADEVTSEDPDQGHVISIVSHDEEVKRVLETLFFDIINVDFNLFGWVRGLCKYGDYVLFVDASETNGILSLLPIPINEIEREEGYDKEDPFAVRFRWLTQGNTILQNWQIIHFRLLGNDNFLPYGASVIEPARRIWRQLILIEDAMLVYRIVRSPERRVFKIDVGNIPAEDVDRFMEEVKTKLRRNQIVDSTTGRVDLRYNPLSVDEDYFLPVRGDKGPTIETLPGGQFTGDIDDVQYIQSKLFAALKVPKAYLGFESELGSKATLAQEDVRFARTIERIQKIVVSELEKIAIIHLFLSGYEGEELTCFNIQMANPSTIAEQQRLELWRMRLEVAATAQEGTFDRRTVYKKIFKLTNSEVADIVEGRKLDKLEDLALEAMTVQPEEPPTPEDDGRGPPAEEPAPGGEELPSTLGGPPGGGPETAGVDRAGPVVSEADVDERHNRGSEGSSAELAVDRGKDLFSTGEDQHTLVFGTEKQTADDPYDRRALRRVVTRPFSEASGRPGGRPEGLLERATRVTQDISHELVQILREWAPKRRG